MPAARKHCSLMRMALYQGKAGGRNQVALHTAEFGHSLP
jgi:hypothetical protein